jgi:hypothetical protein
MDEGLHYYRLQALSQNKVKYKLLCFGFHCFQFLFLKLFYLVNNKKPFNSKKPLLFVIISILVSCPYMASYMMASYMHTHHAF